jgi:hypothetical protein
MKLKNLLDKKSVTESQKQKLEEKKEAIATSQNTNMTLHYDSDYKAVGEEGTPEFSFTISVSSTGGKEYFRGISDKEEGAKLAEGAKLELRRALRRFDKNIQYILDKYKLQAR